MSTRLFRWESPTRYYLAHVQQNLFGCWELVRMWGGKGSRRGGGLCEPAADQAHALQLLDDTGRRREQRGYRPVTTPEIAP
jgi:predicted DNA-binding WGR domain protein